MERKQGEIKWQRPKARCPRRPSEPRSLCFLVNSHQSVLGTGRLSRRFSTRGHQERGARNCRAGPLRGITVTDGGVTSTPAAGVSLSLLRGGVAPQACRRLKAPSSRPLQASTIQATQSVSAQLSWKLAEAGTRERFTDRISRTTSCPTPTPRGDLAAETERASHAHAARIGGLQTDSGSHPAEVCLGKRKPPSHPASGTNPRGQCPPDSWRVTAVLSVAGCVPAPPGGASARSSVPLQGRGVVSLCCRSDPHNHGKPGPADPTQGNAIAPSSLQGTQIRTWRAGGGGRAANPDEAAGSPTRRPGPLCPGRFGAAQKTDS